MPLADTGGWVGVSHTPPSPFERKPVFSIENADFSDLSPLHKDSYIEIPLVLEDFLDPSLHKNVPPNKRHPPPVKIEDPASYESMHERDTRLLAIAAQSSFLDFVENILIL